MDWAQNHLVKHIVGLVRKYGERIDAPIEPYYAWTDDERDSDILSWANNRLNDAIWVEGMFQVWAVDSRSSDALRWLEHRHRAAYPRDRIPGLNIPYGADPIGAERLVQENDFLKRQFERKVIDPNAGYGLHWIFESVWGEME